MGVLLSFPRDRASRKAIPRATEAHHYAVGQRVWYFGGWGSKPPVPAMVRGWGIEKGRVVLDVQTDEGRRVWGFLFQVEPMATQD